MNRMDERESNSIPDARRAIGRRGVLAVAAFTLVALLAVMAVDAATVIFSSAVRWLLSGSAFVVTAVAAYFFLVRPFRRVLSLTSVALRIERRHPELEERLSSAVELLTSRDGPGVFGSEMLISQLVAEACAGVSGLEPEREFSARSARPFLAAAVIALTVLLIAFAAWPARSALLLARAVAPFAGLGNIRGAELTVKPGSVVCARGSSLQVEVLVGRQGAPDAEFRWTVEGGGEKTAPMRRATSDPALGTRFVFGLESLDTTFRYRIHCGGALSAYYDVQVFERPSVTNLVLRYEWPEYTGLAAQEYSVAPGQPADIRAVAGTKVTVRAESSVPLRTIRMSMNGEDVPGTEIRDGRAVAAGVWTVDITPRLAGRWALYMEDRNGLENTARDHAIAAEQDMPPQVSVLSPPLRKFPVKPTDRVTFEYEVADDFGCTSVEVVVVPEGAEPIVLPAAPPVNQGDGTWRGRAGLDLALLSLGSVRKLTSRVRVADNLPQEFGGPQWGESEDFVLDLDPNAPWFVEVQVNAQDAEIRTRLQAALQALQQADTHVAELVHLAGRRVAFDARERGLLEQPRTLLARAETSVREVVDLVPGTAFESIGPPARAVADTHMAPARRSLELTVLTDEPTERIEHARTVRREVDRSTAGVQALIEMLGVLSAQIKEAEKMRALAERERELAARARAADAEQEPEKDWKALQAEIAKELLQRSRTSPAAMAAVLAGFRSRVKALARELRELAAWQEQARSLTPRGHRAELRAPERTGLVKSLRGLWTELEIPDDPPPVSGAEGVRTMLRSVQDGVAAGVETRRKTLDGVRSEFAELEVAPPARSGLDEAANHLGAAQGEARRAAEAIVVEVTEENSSTVTQRTQQVTGAQEKAASELNEAAKKLDGVAEAMAAAAAARRAELARQRAEEAQRRAEYAARQMEREAKRADDNLARTKQSVETAEALAKQAEEQAKAAREAAEKAAQAAAEAKAAAEAQANRDTEDAAKRAMQAEREANERARRAAEEAESARDHAEKRRADAGTEQERADRVKQEQKETTEAAAMSKQKAQEALEAFQKAQQAADQSQQAQAEDFSDMAWDAAVAAEQAAEQAQMSWDQAVMADEKDSPPSGSDSKSSKQADQSLIDKKGPGDGAGAGKGKGIGPTPGASIQTEPATARMPDSPVDLGGVGGDRGGGPVDEEMARALAEAMAARGADKARQAAQHAEEAAERMARLAAQEAMESGMPESAAPVSGDPSGGREPGQGIGGGGRPGSTPRRHRVKGRASADWTRLSSELHDNILQSVGERTPEEFRDLVEEYFRRIAQEAETNGKR